MRSIRVREQNQAAIIKALIKAGFTAEACQAPNSETTWNQASFLDWDDQQDLLAEDLKGMAGIETSASGNQAHKVITSLKEQGVIS